MTTIAELEFCIRSTQTVIKNAEATLERLKAELTELKAQEQLEQESLLGRWATHPEYGRGIIGSDKPDDDKEVRFIFYCDNSVDGVKWEYERLGDLTLDPATLNTAKDFNDAPEGTIAEIMVEPKGVYVKKDNVWFGAGEEYPTPVQSLAKARVIRWGNGK